MSPFPERKGRRGKELKLKYYSKVFVNVLSIKRERYEVNLAKC